MRIDAAEAQRRLASSRNLANLSQRSVVLDSRSPSDVSVPSTEVPILPGTSVSHVEIDRGVRRNCSNVPEPIRDLMSEMVNSGTKACDVASAFGVSADVAERAGSGRVGGRPATQERREAITQRKLDIKDKALLKLMQSFDLLTNEALMDCTAKELSSIMGNMAKVASSMDEATQNAGNQTNIVVYAPQLREEKKFKTIEV